MKRYKIIIILLFGFIAVALFTMSIINNNQIKTSTKELYSLIPIDTEVVFDIQSASEILPYYDLLYADKSLSNATDLVSLLLKYYSDKNIENGLLLISTSLENLKDGLLVIPKGSNISVASLKNILNTSIPPKIFKYRDFDICIYSLNDGLFIATLSLDNSILMSTNIYEIEHFIDHLITKQNLLSTEFKNQILASKGANKAGVMYLRTENLEYGRNKLTKRDYRSESDQKWLAYELEASGNKLIGVALLDSVPINSKSLTKTEQVVLPDSVFAVHQWHIDALLKCKEEVLRLNLMTEKESLWNRIFEATILDLLTEQGIYGFRILDSVVSSELILKISLQDVQQAQKILDEFQLKNRYLIKSLLREEGIYNHRGTLALPTLQCLNRLTDTSRDMRVIYLAFDENSLLLSWDYSLLIKDLNKGTERNKLLQSGSLFYGQPLKILADSLTNYKELPSFLLHKAHRLKDFEIVKYITCLNQQYFKTISLERIAE